MSNTALQNINKNPLYLESYSVTPAFFTVFEEINTTYPDAFNILTDKLNVGISTFDENNIIQFSWKNKFESNADLFNSILCSCHIPYICTYNARMNNCYAIDGGCDFDEKKHLPKNVIKIIVKNKSHIRDCDTYHLCQNILQEHFLLPIPDEYVKKYYENGIKDIEKFLNSRTKFIPKNPAPKFWNDTIKTAIIIMRILQQKNQNDTHTFETLEELCRLPRKEAK